MARIIKRDDDKKRPRPSQVLRAQGQSRQKTDGTKRLKPVNHQTLRLLVPVANPGDEKIITKAKRGKLNVCAVYLAQFRDLNQSEKVCSAVFSGKLEPNEIVSSARLLEASAILVAHLVPNLAIRVTSAAHAVGLATIDIEHPVGKVLVTDAQPE